jgi:hypothetical protein
MKMYIGLAIFTLATLLLLDSSAYADKRGCSAECECYCRCGFVDKHVPGEIDYVLVEAYAYCHQVDVNGKKDCFLTDCGECYTSTSQVGHAGRLCDQRYGQICQDKCKDLAFSMSAKYAKYKAYARCP